MKVHLINSYKDLFKENIEKNGIENALYKYDAHQNFIQHWDLAELNLEDMFDQSFHSKISGRLWGGSVNSPKSMMLIFLQTNREFVRSMFRDLENESLDIAMRVNRFLLHCDEMLFQLQKAGKKINDHYHTRETVSMYLAFQFPEKYTIFNYGHFSGSMKKFEARHLPEAFDIAKFFLLSGTVYRILSKDETLLTLYSAALDREGLNFENSAMLMVSDFYEFVCCN